MRLDKNVLHALRKAITSVGSQREFAGLTGIHEVNISKYLSGKVTKVELETWEKLYPHIKGYLPANSNLPQITAGNTSDGAEEAILKDPLLSREQKRELLRNLHEMYLERKLGPPDNDEEENKHTDK